jgi:selenocysteine-specific elongation factor
MGGRDLVLGTAGHIDHGKTALVRALTGVDTDRLPAEKERGITIDLGFAALELGEDRLALIDVPGHERFIRNMLAGATGLDLALLVVAADDSVMPQTREHLEILRLLGLSGGLVVLTKCDLADSEWLALVEEEVRGLVAGTFLEGTAIVRTSAATGAGIDRVRDELRRLCARVPDRPDPGLFRLSIDRAFTVAGHGTVVTGTVASGAVAVGDELECWPEGRSVRVRGLERHDRPVERIGRGMRAAINLVRVHHTEVRRGHELASPGYLEASRAVSIELRVSEDAPRPLRHRGRYRLHLGTAEVAATLVLLGGNELGPGRSGLGQLFLAEPMAAVFGQPFVLREESPPATLGGGRVLQPSARRMRRDPEIIERLDRLRLPDPIERLASVLGFQGLKPWTEPGLCRLSGLSIGAIPQALAALSERGDLVELPIGPRRSVRVLSTFVDALEDRVLRALGRLHAARPRQSAIPRAHLAATLPDLAGDVLIVGVIERLKRKGRVIGDATAVARADFQPRLSQGERRLKDELAGAIRDGGFSPPDANELADAAGARAAVVPELLALLRDEGRLVEIATGFYLDAGTEAELRRRVVERLDSDATITIAEIRDLLGTTRKYAVPIGEYLDRIGLTLRQGDLRRLGNPSAAPAVPALGGVGP